MSASDSFARTLPQSWRDALVCTALVVWVFAVYRESFAVYFLNEDFTWLRQCQGGPLQAVWALVRPDTGTQVYSWRPVAQFWVGLNYALWGVHPTGYRFGILAWHALAVCTLYFIARRGLDRSGSLVAALVFAAHPLQVESLSWTCACAGVISSTLCLLATLAFLRWRAGRGPAVLVLISFALALLTQESAIVLPALLVATDLLVPNRAREVGARLRLYVGLVAVVGGFLVLRRSFGPATFNYGMVGLDPRLSVSARGLVAFLLGKLRATAAAVLMLPSAATWLALPVTAVIALVAAGLWRGRRPVALWGLLWLGLAVAPFSLLVFGPFARYMHLAMAGFALVFAALSVSAYDRLRPAQPRLASACVAVVVMLWLAQAVHQIGRVQAGFVHNGSTTRTLLLDLLHALPAPRPGSTLAFYGMNDLRQRQGVFVFGLEDAVRLFYEDGSLNVEYRPLGRISGDAYHLWYRQGRLLRLDGIRP